MAIKKKKSFIDEKNAMDKHSMIKKLFEENRDDENAISMSKYMRDMFKYYGISTPVRKSIYKDLLKKEKLSGVIDWVLLKKCYDDEYREFQYFVVDYLSFMQKNLAFDDIPAIKKFITVKSWWDTIDGFDSIIGDISLADVRGKDLMAEWSLDDNIWVRRIAIDHQLCRKEKTDVDLLEEIIVNNFGSKEFFINKAIGWSLREYSKTNPNWVKSFIFKHKDKMDKLSIREASKYI